MWKLPASLPLAPGGALGDAIGQGLTRAIGFNGATLLLLALFAVGFVAVPRHLVAQGDGAHRRRHRGVHRLGPPPARGGGRPQDRRRGDDRARTRRHRSCARKRRSASRCSSCRRPVQVPRSERVVKEKQRPLFTDMPDSPLPPLALLEDAPSAQEIGQHRDARIHVAAHRTQAGGLRRHREGARRLSGPGDHPLRDRARGRREGRADRQPHQGHRARAVGGVDPRRRDDSRQVVHGPGAAQSAPAGGEAGRDPVVDDVQRHAGPAHAGARQGHRRQAGGRRPRAHAAPAGRRHDGLGQVGGGQRDDPVAALQGRAEAGAPDPDRPQDARALDVRGHSAPAGAGRHQHEARAQRAQLVRGRDGAPLQADVACSACATSPATTPRSSRAGSRARRS